MPLFSQHADGTLAGQAQAGSLAAFEELVSRYEGRVYRFVLHSCGSPEDARELTQDIFVRAFHALHSFNLKQDFAPWLFTIARRKCIDRYRSAARPVTEPLPELLDHRDPGELLAAREDRRNLWTKARQALSDTQFQALWFRYAEGLEIGQIAHVMNKSRSHIKVLLFRSRQILSVKLRQPAVATAPCLKPLDVKTGSIPLRFGRAAPVQ